MTIPSSPEAVAAFTARENYDEIDRAMLSDIEIAQRTTLRPIVELARDRLQIPECELEF